MTSTRGYGWIKSLGDQRDLVHNFTGVRAAASVDLRISGFLPSVWDQLDIGSCVMHGCPAGLVFSLAKQKLIARPDDWMPSRLFGYYQGRVLENTVNSDSGLTLTDGFKVLGAGLPPESDWPYVTSKFAQKPPAVAFTDAPKHAAIKYARVVQTAAQMQACLTTGTPFAIGFTVYDSFESDATGTNGVVTMPKSSESVLGGHCMLCVGHMSAAEVMALLKADNLPTTGINQASHYYVMRNSWGTGWGHKGYCYMPEAYLTSTSLSDDFWTVQTASAPDPAPTPPQPTPVPAADNVSRAAAVSAVTKALQALPNA